MIQDMYLSQIYLFYVITRNTASTFCALEDSEKKYSQLQWLLILTVIYFMGK